MFDHFRTSRSLKATNHELKRIANCLEVICSEQYGYSFVATKPSVKDDVELIETDEALDAIREMREFMDKAKGKLAEPEE